MYECVHCGGRPFWWGVGERVFVEVVVVVMGGGLWLNALRVWFLYVCVTGGVGG